MSTGRKETNYQLTPELIAGSAFPPRAGTITAGFTYSWLDNSGSDQRAAGRTFTPTPPPIGT